MIFVLKWPFKIEIYVRRGEVRLGYWGVVNFWLSTLVLVF